MSRSAPDAVAPDAASVDGLLGLAGARVLVSGGRGGIGVAIVEQLRAAGAQVASADISPPQGEGLQLQADLSDAEAARGLVDQAVEALGGLDLLVHSAGLTRDGVLWKLEPEDWSAVLAVNLDAAFHLLAAATPQLRKSERAAVVLLSSINGERGKFGQANYAASKAGLIGLARTAARELGHFGVRVNVVAPGLIDTPMTADLPQEVRERSLAETALGRVGSPEDVARAVLFLGSRLASHVTGQVLRVDGGQLMA